VLSISGGKLVKASGGTSGYGRVGMLGDAQTRAAGLALFVDWSFSSMAIAPLFGFSNFLPASLGHANSQYYYASSAMHTGDAVKAGIANPTSASKYLFIDRAAGGFYVVDGTLYWVAVEAIQPTHTKPFMSNYTNTNAATFDTFGALSLPANGYTKWGADFSTVTDSKTNPASGTTFEHDDGFHCRFSFTHEDTKNVVINFNRVDANNITQVTAANNGNLQVVDWNDGASTVLFNAATFADGVAYQVDVHSNGSDISVFVDNVEKYSGTDVLTSKSADGSIHIPTPTTFFFMRATTPFQQ
jgi:hypothetical protein